jgi:hypothetical protein
VCEVDDGRLVVVPLDGDLAVVHHLVQAAARVGTVADDVPQAEDVFDALGLDIGQYHAQRFQVCMDVANQSTLHAPAPFCLP